MINLKIIALRQPYIKSCKNEKIDMHPFQEARLKWLDDTQGIIKIEPSHPSYNYVKLILDLSYLILKDFWSKDIRRTNRSSASSR